MNKEAYLLQKKQFEEYKLKISSSYVDAWLDTLNEHTFATVMIPVSRQQADSLIACHLKFIKNGIIAIPDDLKSLESLVDESVQRFGCAFVKSSSRSPKDVVSSRMESLFKDKLSKLPQLEQDDNNIRYSLLASAATEALLCKTGSEVMYLFICSVRIHEDLIEAKEFESDKFNFSIVVREWYAPISIDYEFRCFYNNGGLTAISQYNYLCCYKHIILEQERIRQRIVDFVKTLTLPESCVLDLFVGEKEIKVIELNPFESATGTLLFDWKRDSEILNNGPLEMRVTTQLLSSYSFIQPEYKHFFV